MAKELETKIMSEAGLHDYRFMNGSSSCEYRRKTAAKDIPKIINKYYNEGNEIIPAQKSLTDLIKEASISLDTSNKEVTNTYRVAADVLMVHTKAFGLKPEDRKKFIEDSVSRLRNYYGLEDLSKIESIAEKYKDKGRGDILR